MLCVLIDLIAGVLGNPSMRLEELPEYLIRSREHRVPLRNGWFLAVVDGRLRNRGHRSPVAPLAFATEVISDRD